MIKVNLLPTKRAKRGADRGGPREPSPKDMWVGIGALAAGAVLIFAAVDRPRRKHLHEVEDGNAQLQQEINAKKKQLEGYEAMKKAFEEDDQREQSIARLNQAKSVPANVLHEIGEILTPSRAQPTMTHDMEKKTGTGTESDVNKKFDLAWDPTHVWITTFTDNANDGTFKLEGGAQAQVDIIQLSKRMQASVYFDQVSQQSEDRMIDRDTGITYYKFLITGKVAY